MAFSSYEAIHRFFKEFVKRNSHNVQANKQHCIIAGEIIQQVGDNSYMDQVESIGTFAKQNKYGATEDAAHNSFFPD